jgi:hypothetical protein
MLDLCDESGNIWHTQEARVKRLNKAVRGAHLVVPFQCETCRIRLLENREPTPEDSLYKLCIRRAKILMLLRGVRSPYQCSCLQDGSRHPELSGAQQISILSKQGSIPKLRLRRYGSGCGNVA